MVKKINPKAEFTISDLGIRDNAVLCLKENRAITCKVHGPNRVFYEGKEMSLSESARLALGYQQANGWKHWTYKGDTLADLRSRYYAKVNVDLFFK